MENPVDINKNSSGSVKLADSHNTPSTSRYGRARKPKSYFKDYYNTDDVVKNPQKRGTKSISPKTQKKTKPTVSDDFVHVTGDADVLSEAVVKPLAETTEVNFDNFMKSVSEEIGNLKPVETSVKERKFFKSTQESKLQASTISYISKVSPKQPIKPVELPLENELIEPEVDVNKVIKIVTKPTDIIEQPTDSQKSQKNTVKTYGNKRKPVQSPGVFETFGLPDKPILVPSDGSKVVKSMKTKDIDVVIDTADKNQINMDTNASNTTTFFGVKLSPEKPRDLTLIDSPITSKALSPTPPKTLITSVARIAKVQPTVTKIKSVISSDTAKQIFASVSKQNTITIVPKATNIIESSATVSPKEQMSPIKSQAQSVQSMNIAADMPTCKIKSITSVTDPKNINNNNQEKKFVKVVMDKSKILKVLPTSGGSPIKLSQDANTSEESDKSDTSIGSPPYSPIIPKIATNHKVSLPSVISHAKTIAFASSTTSTPILVSDPSKTSPRIIASSKLIRREYMTPISPVKVINVPAKEIVSPAKLNVSPIKTSPITGEVVGRKRKQELILRKDIEHSYSISPPDRTVLPVSPKKKFMARLKTEDSPKVILEEAILDTKKEIIKQNLDSKDVPEKEEEIMLTESEQESPKVEKEIPNINDKDEQLKQEKIEDTIKSDSFKVTSKNLSESGDLVLKTVFPDVNISPVVRLKQLQLDEDNQAVKSSESTLDIINKPLDTVGKNVVRVSPRKGKGMNAFLWETNSGAFFIKHTAKPKVPEVQIKEASKKEPDDLINEASIVEETESKRISYADNGSLIKKEDLNVEESSPLKEEHHEEVDADIITKDIVKKLKASPISKELNKKSEEDIAKKLKASPVSKELNKKSTPHQEQLKQYKRRSAVLSKAKQVTKSAKTVSKLTKTIVKMSKAKKSAAKDQPELGPRQLRTRKFIFAEQITSTNRNTITKVLDKTPKPSKEDFSIRLVKKNIDVKNKKRIADKIKREESSEVLKVAEDEFSVDQESASLIPEKLERKKRRIQAVKRFDMEAKELKPLKKSKKSQNVNRLCEDVILVATQKKVIVINSDDEADNVDKSKLKQRQEKSDTDFVLQTEIKKEKVTPEKMTVADTVNVGKRKRRGPPRNYIEMLKMSDEEEELEPEKVVSIKKSAPKKVPMPIVSKAKSNIKLDVKEEKTELENLEDVSVEDSLKPDQKIRIKKENTLSSKYSEGDMVWAKVGCHPYWPAMITKDPTKNSIKQTIKSAKLINVPYYHVRYFADNGRRSWVRATALMHYKHSNDLEILINATKPTHTKKYKVPKSKYALWRLAIDELESIKSHSILDKLEFFIKASIRSAKKKKNLSPRIRGIKREKPGYDLEDTQSNISYKTLSSTRKIPIAIPEIKTPTSSRQRLSSVDTLSKDSPRSHIDRFLQSQLEDKMSWKKLRSSRSIDDDQSQLKLESDINNRLKDFDTTDCSSSETDSIQNKISLSGPIPCSIEYQELLHKRNNLFRKVSRDKVCEICFKPKNVLSCQGPCSGFYHLDCANGYLDDSSLKICDTVSIKLLTKAYKKTTLNRLRNRDGKIDKSESISGNSSDNDSKKSQKDKKTPKNTINTFICGSCDGNNHCVCFVCSKEVSPTGDHVITKCKVAKCGKAFHRDCTRLWPQVQWLDKSTSSNMDSTQVLTSVICPRHVCHICVSDDPKAVSARTYRSEALVRCLLCPATYHSLSGCIPAGTEIYTYSQIVCPRHLTLPHHLTGALSTSVSSVVEGSEDGGTSTTPAQQEYLKKPLPPINTTWCFICSIGGDLVCCETCPTSVHEACSSINWLDDGSYVCEDCETGRLILYDEVVWAKLGSYRWWPALVLFPKDIPVNIRNMRHRRGEFVIKFFGSYDYFWMGHGRVFLYQEGDKGTSRLSGKNPKSMEVTFAKSIEEAAKAFALKRDFKQSLLQSESRQPKNVKPPAYIKLRFNKPVGNVKVYEANVSITTPCSCDPKSDSPCGPDTHCLNRILWTECNPRNCPAGGRCQNQQFETRQYPPLAPYKTDERGWGVKSSDPIVVGQFVIEYVGEVIEEQEYKRRVANMQNQSEQNYYFLTIDSDRIIDAGPKGNVARFMNHSCDPNCETQKWTVNGDTRVGLFACKDIPANNELTFNYNLEPNGKTLLECKCKAASCSGFIGVKKAAENPKAKILSEKVVLKKKKRLGKSGYSRNMSLLDRRCFICGKEGRLITCSNLACSETYHIECVQLMNVPYAFWRCPRHYCKVCHERVVKRCKLCINSYCMQHCSIKTEGKIIEFVCPDHKDPSTTIKGEKSSKVTKDDFKEETSHRIEAIDIKVMNDDTAAISLIPKEEKLDINKKESSTSKKVKAKPLKAIEKIAPTKKKSSNKKRRTSNKKIIKVKLTTKRQSRRSR